MKRQNLVQCYIKSEGKMIWFSQHLWNKWNVLIPSWLYQYRECSRCGYTQDDL